MRYRSTGRMPFSVMCLDGEDRVIRPHEEFDSTPSFVMGKPVVVVKTRKSSVKVEALKLVAAAIVRTEHIDIERVDVEKQDADEQKVVDTSVLREYLEDNTSSWLKSASETLGISLISRKKADRVKAIIDLGLSKEEIEARLNKE